MCGTPKSKESQITVIEVNTASPVPRVVALAPLALAKHQIAGRVVCGMKYQVYKRTKQQYEV